MLRPFRVCRLFGIDIRIHPTFWLLPLGLGTLYAKDYGPEVGLRAASLVLIVFACVLGHELAHSFVARRYGIAVPEITLYPMGGVAGMQHIPRKPSQEFWISIAGPLFNFGLAAVLYFPLLWWLGAENLASPSLGSWPRTMANAFWLNPVLGLFNLIPAFPMDGGRILRALLATRMEYGRATRISARFGLFFAILFFLLGIWKRHWILTLVAAFVYFAASREIDQVRVEDALKRLRQRNEPSA